jgi:sensor histidine kinase YesM
MLTKIPTRRIIIFILLALLICLFANINQIVAAYLADMNPRPHKFPRPPFNPEMFRYRLAWEMGLSFLFALVAVIGNSGVWQASLGKRKVSQATVVALSFAAGLAIFFFLYFAFFPHKYFPSRFFFLILSKAIFVIMAAIAAGQLYRLIWQKQDVELENEKLKTDNLQSRYQGLMNQLNPHFLFNSLNSLAFLIRENEQKKALTFIDELSSIFRYVLQKRNDELVTLEDEIQFTEAYRYLLSIRFENKLFFELRIDEQALGKKLPFLTLQPLIENAVKHNTVSAKHPLAIFIYTSDDNLIISNPKNAKLSEPESTGIGLTNLSNRYKLLTGKQLTVVDDEKTFMVIIPLC